MRSLSCVRSADKRSGRVIFCHMDAMEVLWTHRFNNEYRVRRVWTVLQLCRYAVVMLCWRAIGDSALCFISLRPVANSQRKMHGLVVADDEPTVPTRAC